MANLFRAKSKKTNEWVYGWYFVIGDTHYITPNELSVSDEIEKVTTFLSKPVLPETVGQYTGLKDKNGVEIYAGDRIHYCYFDDFDNDTHYELPVLWDEDYLCYGIRVNDDTFFDLMFLSQDEEREVIGNIHDEEKP